MTRTARDESLDAFRGLAVLGMVIVNLQGSEQASFAMLVHSPWNGVTIADLVFPFFLLASGLAVPLSIDSRPHAGQLRKAALRAGRLIAIGLILGWLLHPSLNPSELRTTGVLQRIAIVYLCCAALCLYQPGWRRATWAAVMLLALHGGLLLLSAAYGGSGALAPGGGLSGWLDRVVLPGRLYRGTYDPEGILSTLSSIATGFIGVVVQRRLGKATGATSAVLAYGLGCMVLAIATLPLLPWNKTLWTPGFALASAGLGLSICSLLRSSWPHIHTSALARLLVILGQTALTLFVVHMLIIAVLVSQFHDQSLWEASFALIAKSGLPPAWASLSYALIAGFISVAITLMLRRRGWLIRA